jgi:queuine tRNA-ribosyltransferase
MQTAPDPPLRYELLARDTTTHARLGRVTTRHGVFDTPVFMPVGTQGTVKGLLPDHVAATGSQIILGNTYHLMLRPGEQVVADLGDLHRFMSWPGPILTDSGGFQVFSLADINRITDDGVTFKSHVDGSMVHLTPARSIQVQNALGADIIMAFDECPPGDAPREYHVKALQRTLRWAELCVQAHARPNDQSLFGIVQGGTDLELRAHCLAELAKLDLPGYAIGGLAVGEGFEGMKKVLAAVGPALPDHKPRYLMGVGFPRDIIELRNSKYLRDAGPIEEGCDCYACRAFTKGAVRHFFFAGEMLGPILVSLHNIRFYQRLMADVRQAIGAARFEEFRQNDPRCRLGPRGQETEDVTRDA